MTITPVRMASAAYIPTSLTTLYTCPSSTVNGAVVRKAVFNNVSGTSASFTLYVVPTGGTAGASNQVISSVTVQNGSEPYIAAELGNLVLNPGDTIQALASTASAIVAMISGFTF